MLLVGNQKGLVLLNSILLPIIKHFGYKVGLQFNNNALVVEQNNYVTRIVNTCIANELHVWCD